MAAVRQAILVGDQSILGLVEGPVNTRRRVLVVTHEASRTGAPRVALDVIEALEMHGITTVAVVRWPGSLSPEFDIAADRTRLEPLRRLRVFLRRFRRTRRLAIAVEQKAAGMVLRQERPDLVYLNTVKSACYVRPAVKLGLPVILHSHELGNLASATLARYRIEKLYDHVRLVACSDAAAEQLRAITGCNDVVVVPSSVDPERIRRLRLEDGGESTAPADRRRLVTCGTADDRKGADLWLETARLLLQTMGDGCPDFLWIGADPNHSYQDRASQLGLDRIVRFVGPRANPFPLVASGDLLIVPSREDAFPLAVLEGMALGLAVVAFDVGGIPDQVGDCGALVPAGDAAAMAGTIRHLLEDSERRRALGECGAARVEERFSIGRFREKVASLVDEELRG